MAQSTFKRRPWAVEMKPSNDRWYEIAGFGDKASAEAHMKEARYLHFCCYPNSAQPEYRVRNIARTLIYPLTGEIVSEVIPFPK